LLYTKEIKPEKLEFSIEELITQAENMVLETIIKKQIKVDKQVDEIKIDADFELLKQCIANILINAAQAVEINGKIEIFTEKGNHGLILKIKDNGSGIPADIQDKIFNPFFTTKTTGTGLGLAMVKRVIESHSGKISFESNVSGTLFVIELPI
jgi:two-component system sensor histidine kinase AtoS